MPCRLSIHCIPPDASAGVRKAVEIDSRGFGRRKSREPSYACDGAQPLPAHRARPLAHGAGDVQEPLRTVRRAQAWARVQGSGGRQGRVRFAGGTAEREPAFATGRWLDARFAVWLLRGRLPNAGQGKIRFASIPVSPHVHPSPTKATPGLLGVPLRPHAIRLTRSTSWHSLCSSRWALRPSIISASKALPMT